MAHKSVLALVALLLFGIPQPIENGLDEDAQMSTEDLEQATPEPPEPSWRPVLMAALQQGPYWAAADLLFLPLYLWFRRTRAAKRQRAAARQAEVEARRRRREIEQRRLRLKRTVRDLKEMWRTMNTIRKKTARLVGTSRKMSRRAKVSSAGFGRSTDSGRCEEKLPAGDALRAGQGEPHVFVSSQRTELRRDRGSGLLPDPAPLHCISKLDLD
ncbi:hypothetical protein DUI87_24756 [Hirundo rustica rustica]|uniref:Uncharacterized protein n=1 Tax=Hirundo rustica rustica TaxID=333673 RepID=A0A3M0JC69_HIRRU|nr:hypothetical protein DUI87_24756 [Hirundo rustica rustica]